MRFLVLALVLGWLPLAAMGQSCNFWHAITFADGKQGCLTDYPIARAAPYGFSRPLQDLITVGYTGHSVALPTGGPQCPAVIGVSAGGGIQGNGPSDPATIRLREGVAVSACESALKSAGAAAGCSCQVGWSNNRSPLTKDAFDRLAMGKGGATTAQAATPAPAPVQAPAQAATQVQQPAPRAQAVPAPAPVAAAPASPPPAAAAGPTAAQTQEMLIAMQKRLAELEAARSAQAAAPPPQAAPQPPPQPVAAAVPRLSVRALVIGNSKYSSFGALPNPQRDATAIAAKLRSFGIPVDLVLDANRDDLIQALNEHSRKAAGIDVSILFYAGHGMQVEGVNYLIPVNMRADGISAGYVKLAGISLNAALDYLPAKTRLVFLDACRDNPATRTLVATRSGASVGLAPVQVASGTLLSYATRDGATADDGNGLNSPYTTALLRHLDNPVDISLVLRQVRQTVLQLTSGRQEPWEYGSLVGDQIVLPLLRR